MSIDKATHHNVNLDKAIRQIHGDVDAELKARISIVVPKKYHANLKKVAIENNMSITQFVLTAVNDKINKNN